MLDKQSELKLPTKATLASSAIKKKKKAKIHPSDLLKNPQTLVWGEILRPLY